MNLSLFIIWFLFGAAFLLLGYFIRGWVDNRLYHKLTEENEELEIEAALLRKVNQEQTTVDNLFKK